MSSPDTDPIVRPVKRRRAAVACEYCRKRKRKCDGKQPICGLCEESNHLPCEYRHTEVPGDKPLIDTSQVVGILNRLDVLERSVDNLTSTWNSDTLSACGPMMPVDSMPSRTPETQSLTPQFTNTGSDLNTTMDIPLSHSTTLGNLLRSPPARVLLGEYPPDIFLNIEIQRPIPELLRLNPTPLDQIKLPTITRPEADELIQNYLSKVHGFYPILDEGEFSRLANEILGQGCNSDIPSAQVLAVLSLGKISTEKPDTTESFWTPSGRFIAPAVSILLTEGIQSFGGSLLLPQSLYLAALYYSFLSRPLQAWRLVHMASTDVQHYWIRRLKVLQNASSSSHDQSILRLCWAIFMLECDIIAEHHLPRSGIEHVVERLPFPRFGNPADATMLQWLANLSSRRLLNRIHHVLYDEGQSLAATQGMSDDPTDAVHDYQSSQFGISQELNHQLHAWYELLPPDVKPDLNNPPRTIDESVLLMRYHASGDIIFRPFLLQLCALPSTSSLSDSLVENAKFCLQHCRGYLLAVEHALAATSASLEIFLHSTTAAILLLTLASYSKALAPCVSDIATLQQKAIAIVKPWAFPNSSIETMLCTLQILKAKHMVRA